MGAPSEQEGGNEQEISVESEVEFEVVTADQKPNPDTKQNT